MHKITTIMVVCMLFICVSSILAQGTSPIKINSISVTPTTFKAGDTITIHVNLENTANRNYGCPNMAVVIFVYKQKPYQTTNLIWRGHGSTTMFAPHEKKTVPIPGFVVPVANYPELHIQAWSPCCAPDEFGQVSVIVIKQECVYKYIPKVVIPPIPPILPKNP